jgi:serine O-acetyltransferase
MPIDPASPSATVPDWSREKKSTFEWSPPRSLLASLRSYHRWKPRGILGWLPAKIAVLRHRFWSIITGCEIPLNTQVGGGLVMPHPNGVVIHPECTIGPNCLIFQQVTLGNRGSEGQEGVPVIGGHVDIGAGAKILGAVTIGDHAVIGANSVVLVDVPSGATAIGVPARIIFADDGAV